MITTVNDAIAYFQELGHQIIRHPSEQLYAFRFPLYGVPSEAKCWMSFRQLIELARKSKRSRSEAEGFLFLREVAS